MAQPIQHPTLYRRDGTGRIRTWSAERQGNAFRTTSGLLGRKAISSGWITCRGKQGRCDEEQARAQVESAYRYHEARDYHLAVEDVDRGRYFAPMLADKYVSFAPGFAQPKLDGIRCIARADGLFSREGRPITGVPHIAQALEHLFRQYPALVLDGELYNHALRHDFNQIVRAVRRRQPDVSQLQRAQAVIQFHVYDMPSLGQPFSVRSRELAMLVHDMPAIVAVDTVRVDTQHDYDALHAGWIAAGYEGSMWRADLPYEQKRSKRLLKRKPVLDAEFECIAIEEGRGQWQGMAKRAVCRLPDGRTFAANIKGDRAFTRALLSSRHRIVTVEYLHLTPAGIPRFPIAVRFWGDCRDC